MKKLKKDDVLAQDFRQILSDKFGVDYETEEYNEVSEGGTDCDVMIDTETGEVSLVEQGWGSTFEQQNANYECIAKFANIRWEEDLEDIVERIFDESSKFFKG